MIADLPGPLGAYSPKLIDAAGNRQAAVALILGQGRDGAEMLFIERAAHENDPWSGQIAFPGGRREDHDADMLAAACRETLEEVGIDLTRRMCLGRLDDQQGSSGGRSLTLTIGCFVFAMPSPQSLQWNYEVASAFWMPLTHLRAPGNQMQYETSYRDQPYPAIRLAGERVLWGLTYRFTQNLLDIIP